MALFHFRRKLSTKLFVSLFGLAWVLRWLIITSRPAPVPPPPFAESPREFKNYFNELDRLANLNRIVDTTSCRIPDFDPWDSAVAPFLKKAVPLGCVKANHNHSWSSLVGNELIMHTDQMEQDGYSIGRDVHCCYSVIDRVEQSLSNYNEDADSRIKLSSCVKITEERTILRSEFVEVKCSWTNELDDEDIRVVYRGYHGSALTKDITKTGEKGRRPRKPSLLNKVNHWKDKKEKLLRAKGLAEEFQLPPNILVIGQDSTSRLNFRRNMIKTRTILESLGAVEMLGYIKVGENTFPNMCPILTGYPEEDFKRLCHSKDELSVDNCPFIFRRFDEANYLTAFIEDAPFYAIFNYKRTGFVHQPVDFYARPLFIGALSGLAAAKRAFVNFKLKLFNVDCIGSQTNDEMIVSYLESTLEFAHRTSSPLFALTWSTTLTHENTNAAQLADDPYSEFLRKIEDKGYLNNTILIFMGDHGYRYGPIKETLVGYFEDRLPNMWIRLPPAIREKYPEWVKALQINSARLTSPHVLYWSLQSLLEEFTQVERPVQDESTREDDETISRPPGRYTFFEEIPEDSSCKDVGIPEQFCPCYPLEKVTLGDPLLWEAAEHAVDFINENILKGSECYELSLTNVTTGAYMNKSNARYLNSGDKRDTVESYIVGFVASPESILVEAFVDFFHGNSTFYVYPNVQRMNKLNGLRIKCARSSKIELFCICPP